MAAPKKSEAEREWVDLASATNGEISTCAREAIKRLKIALDDTHEFSASAKGTLGSNIRGLFRGVPFADIEALIKSVIAKHGFGQKPYKN